MTIYKFSSAIAAVALTGIMLSSCIDETFPESNYLTSDQIAAQPSALEGYVNAIPGTMAKLGVYSSSTDWDLGYSSMGMIRDMFCEDFPPYDPTYSYFLYYENNTYLGEYATSDFFWTLFYKYLGNVHCVLRSDLTDLTRPYFGIAHFYRALIYFDMARMYEYKTTGYSQVDALAESNGAYGLTVPIITEKTTEAEARNIPRAKFYDMYRFLLDDLDKAEEYLTGYNRAKKSMPDLAVVYGQKARVYLEMATRFDLHPEDYDTVVAAGVDLGVTDARSAYAKAAEYARMAINKSKAVPLAQSEWYGGSNYIDGFNSVTPSSWMLGLIINKELLEDGNTWKSFISYVSPESHFGLAGITNDKGVYTNTYKCQRMISTALYKTISNTDWRKKTWLDPADEGDPSAISKYYTSVTPEHFSKIPAYAGFKFRPVGGERLEINGSAADYPLMRVEEMYLIEAEALAGAQSLGAGKSALEEFVNDYRYTRKTYKCSAADMDAFRTEVLRQKRIEFWGEGLVYWDYKRLERGVTRGYDGSNYPSAYMLNTNPDKCAPWFNLYIMRRQIGMNPAMKPNPDPSTVKIKTWSAD